jgi:hypothetical protein
MSRLFPKRRKWRQPKTFNVDRAGARRLPDGAGVIPSGYEVFHMPDEDQILVPQKAHAYINRRGEYIAIDPRDARRKKDVE